MRDNKLKNRLRPKCLIGLILTFFPLFFTTCSFSYSFQDEKINYRLIKTITIRSFRDSSRSSYPFLSQILEQSIKNRYMSQTRLIQVPNNGDIEIEGDIIRYDVLKIANIENSFVDRIRLTIEVKVKYINNKGPKNDTIQFFSEFLDCQANQLIVIQESLVREIANKLADMICDATVTGC